MLLDIQMPRGHTDIRIKFGDSWKAQLINVPFAFTDSWLNVPSFKSPLR